MTDGTLEEPSDFFSGIKSKDLTPPATAWPADRPIVKSKDLTPPAAQRQPP